jgi:hypothetical protein
MVCLQKFISLLVYSTIMIPFFFYNDKIMIETIASLTPLGEELIGASIALDIL